MAYSIQTSTLYSNTPFPQIGGQLGCISGYISNPDSANPASVIIYGVNKTGKISRSIAANGYLIFRSLEFEYIINTSTINLEIVYSQDTNFLLEESQSIVNIGTTVDINISGISGSVTIPISGNVNITNTSLNVAGTVNIGNTANINISSISSGVTIPISGSVNVTNSSLTVTGTVDIGNTTNINISSISSGVTIPISGNVNVTNSSLTVTGTVDIGNTTNINISSISSGVTIPISGSVDITNSSIAVTGTIDIGNNITINGNVNTLTTDIAQQDVTLVNQPNQLSGFYDTGRYILDGAQYVGVQIVLAPNQSILISRVIAYTVATVSSGSGNVITTGALSDDTGLINRMWLMLSNDYASQYVPGSGSATIQSLDYYTLLLNLTTSPVLNGGKASVQVLHADFKYNRYVVNTSSSNLTLQIIYTQNSSQPSQNSGVIIYYEGFGTVTTYTNGSLGTGSGGSGGGGGGGAKKIT